MTRRTTGAPKKFETRMEGVSLTLRAEDVRLFQRLGNNGISQGCRNMVDRFRELEREVAALQKEGNTND